MVRPEKILHAVYAGVKTLGSPMKTKHYTLAIALIAFLGHCKGTQFAPSSAARPAIFCPTCVPSFRPSLTSSWVWMPASNVEVPASLAMDVNNSASLGNKADMMAADAPEAHACPDG